MGQRLTGTVAVVRSEADRDTHVEVIPDPAFGALCFTGQNYVVVEPMPGQNIPLPKAGDKIDVMGTHVYDTNHGHNEIHPVLRWNGTDTPPVVPPVFAATVGEPGYKPDQAGAYALSPAMIEAEKGKVQ